MWLVLMVADGTVGQEKVGVEGVFVLMRGE